MKITMIEVTKIVPVLLLSSSIVEARLHTQCWCSIMVGKQWTYDWQITVNACANNYSGEAIYDHTEGRCHWYRGHHVDGRDWNKVCEQQAKDGYYPIIGDDIVDTTAPRIIGKQAHGFCR